MARMGKGEFSCAALEETQYLIKKPWAKVWEEKKQGVEFPGHKNVKATMERDLAMLRENQMDCCDLFQNATAQNPQTPWRRNDTGAPPTGRLRQPTPEPTQRLPGMPPLPPSDTEVAHAS